MSALRNSTLIFQVSAQRIFAVCLARMGPTASRTAAVAFTFSRRGNEVASSSFSIH